MRHRAPNRPLRLLTVIDLFAQGLNTANLIEPGDDLIDLFGVYWVLVMLLDRRGALAMPFFYLPRAGCSFRTVFPPYDLAFAGAPYLPTCSAAEQERLVTYGERRFAALQAQSLPGV